MSKEKELCWGYFYLPWQRFIKRFNSLEREKLLQCQNDLLDYLRLIDPSCAPEIENFIRSCPNEHVKADHLEELANNQPDNLPSYHMIIYAQRVYQEVCLHEQGIHVNKEIYKTFAEAQLDLGVSYKDLLISPLNKTEEEAEEEEEELDLQNYMVDDSRITILHDRLATRYNIMHCWDLDPNPWRGKQRSFATYFVDNTTYGEQLSGS